MIKPKQRGYSLIEVLMGLSILLIVSVSIFSLVKLSFRLIGRSAAKITATNLANQQMERLRNMPYNQLGTTEGWPHGNVPSQQIKALNQVNFTIKTDIQYVDDPLDNLAPQDLYNADYKKARVAITWDKYPGPEPVILVSTFVPVGVESPEGGGTLSLSVIDASTNPVGEVSVHIENKSLTPNIFINTQTDGQGKLLVPALPQDTGNNYAITVTKFDYTSDYTSAVTAELPQPLLPHQPISEGLITSVTFTIDKTSDLKIITKEKKRSEGWCDKNYKFRKEITIQNDDEKILPANTAINFDLFHKQLVTDNKSKANGDDIRLFHFDGTNCLQLDRINTSEWNSDTPTKIWFKTKGDVAAGSVNHAHFVYYNYADAVEPPHDAIKIFNPSGDDNTLALYYAEEHTGTTLNDSSVKNNHGTLNDTIWTEGKEGGAIEFNDASPASYISVPAASGSTLDIINSLTLETWIYPKSLTGKQSIIDRDKNYALWLEDNRVNFGLYENLNSEVVSLTSNITLPINAWSHIAGTYNHSDGTYKIFINGTEDTTKIQKIGEFYPNNAADLRMGNGYVNGDLNSQLFGKIDNIRISDVDRASFPYAKTYNYTIILGDETQPIMTIPLPNLAFKVEGTKILGFDGENKGILRNKFLNKTTNAEGKHDLLDIEWDEYNRFEESNDFDLAEVSPANPMKLPPNQTLETTLTLMKHEENTLRVIIKDSAGNSVSDVKARLTKIGYDETETTQGAGQAFFSPLEKTQYNLEITKTGYITVSESVEITGNSEKEVILTPNI